MAARLGILVAALALFAASGSIRRNGGCGGGVRARRAVAGPAIPPTPQVECEHSSDCPWGSWLRPSRLHTRGKRIEGAEELLPHFEVPAAAPPAAAPPAGTPVRGEYEVTPGCATIVLVGREQCGIRGATDITTHSCTGSLAGDCERRMMPAHPAR